jgi:hypothetical protein
MIIKHEHAWWLLSHDGKKILGVHATKAKAKAQEYAINISKARAAGHHIPRSR